MGGIYFICYHTSSIYSYSIFVIDRCNIYFCSQKEEAKTTEKEEEKC
jgi:hypothetical protein